MAQRGIRTPPRLNHYTVFFCCQSTFAAAVTVATTESTWPSVIMAAHPHSAPFAVRHPRRQEQRFLASRRISCSNLADLKWLVQPWKASVAQTLPMTSPFQSGGGGRQLTSAVRLSTSRLVSLASDCLIIQSHREDVMWRLYPPTRHGEMAVASSAILIILINFLFKWAAPLRSSEDFFPSPSLLRLSID